MDDVRDANAWYEGEVEGLGRRFQEAFFQAVAAAAENPEIYFKAYGEFRRVLLKRFPYALYFRVHGETVVFVLLFHGARQPEKLREQLRRRN